MEVDSMGTAESSTFGVAALSNSRGAVGRGRWRSEQGLPMGTPSGC